MIDRSPTTLILVRHGAVHNPYAVYYGRQPRFRLSQLGQAQAQAAAQALRDLPAAAIYSSPLLRARQTAACLAQARHDQPPLRMSRLLLEVHTPYDGAAQAQLDGQNWNLYGHGLAGYEQPADVLARAQRFIRGVLKHYPGLTVVAVTHGDVIAFTLLWALRAPLTVIGRQRLDQWGLPDAYPATASLTILRFEDGDATPVQPSHITYLKPYPA